MLKELHLAARFQELLLDGGLWVRFVSELIDSYYFKPPLAGTYYSAIDKAPTHQLFLFLVSLWLPEDHLPT